MVTVAICFYATSNIMEFLIGFLTRDYCLKSLSLHFLREGGLFKGKWGKDFLTI